MSVPRFHCARTFAAGERTALPDDVFHHAARVRRLRIGDEIVLFAGDGAETRARLTAVTRSAAEIAILDVRQVERESPLPVTLIQGISAGDRMDYTLQKAVELGIAAIVPTFAERSVVRLAGERAATLVVVGTSGRGSASALYLGSVSHAVARASPVPVLLVPRRPAS
jgi:16S rRNA (uracil1498-N3)-methyltransferase